MLRSFLAQSCLPRHSVAVSLFIIAASPRASISESDAFGVAYRVFDNFTRRTVHYRSRPAKQSANHPSIPNHAAAMWPSTTTMLRVSPSTTQLPNTAINSVFSLTQKQGSSQRIVPPTGTHGVISSPSSISADLSITTSTPRLACGSHVVPLHTVTCP